MGVATITGTVSDPAGVETCNWSSPSLVRWVPLLGPNLTVVAPLSPVPVIVTTVPPAVGPRAGATAVMVGAPAAV